MGKWLISKLTSPAPHLYVTVDYRDVGRFIRILDRYSYHHREVTRGKDGIVYDVDGDALDVLKDNGEVV